MTYTGGTRNMFNHLKLKHSSDISGWFTPEKQPSVADFANSPRSQKLPSSQNEHITRAIAEMVVLDYMWLNLVEGKEFLNLMSILAVETFPSRLNSDTADFSLFAMFSPVCRSGISRVSRTLNCKFQDSLMWCSVTVMKLFVAFDVQVSVVKDTVSTSFKSDINFSFLSQYIISILDFTVFREGIL
jgi:hypothetical protein